MTQDDTIDILNDLIETNKDGEYGYRSSAEHLKAADTQALFERRAEDCRKAASELQALVVQHGGKPEDSGSAVGAMHRGWVAVKGSLSGYDDKDILELTESAEDTALESYRESLSKDLPKDVRTLLARQFESSKRHHVQVRSLRDQARATAE